MRGAAIQRVPFRSDSGIEFRRTSCQAGVAVEIMGYGSGDGYPAVTANVDKPFVTGGMKEIGCATQIQLRRDAEEWMATLNRAFIEHNALLSARTRDRIMISRNHWKLSTVFDRGRRRPASSSNQRDCPKGDRTPNYSMDMSA